jgi:hypothetical protein
MGSQLNIDAVGAAIDQSLKEYSDLLGCSCSVFAARRSGLLSVGQWLGVALPRGSRRPPAAEPPPASVAAAALPRPRTAQPLAADRRCAAWQPPKPSREESCQSAAAAASNGQRVWIAGTGVGRGDWEKRRHAERTESRTRSARAQRYVESSTAERRVFQTYVLTFSNVCFNILFGYLKSRSGVVLSFLSFAASPRCLLLFSMLVMFRRRRDEWRGWGESFEWCRIRAGRACETE